VKRRGSRLIWPLYFDISVSRRQGRRVAKELAMRNPSVAEIASAASELGLTVETEPQAAHPSQPWSRTGVVYVSGGTNKASVLQQLAEKAIQRRSTRRSG